MTKTHPDGRTLHHAMNNISNRNYISSEYDKFFSMLCNLYGVTFIYFITLESNLKYSNSSNIRLRITIHVNKCLKNNMQVSVIWK